MKQSRPERILDRRTRLQIKVTMAAVLVIMTAAAVAGIATGPRPESSHAQEPHGGEAQAASQNVTRVGGVLQHGRPLLSKASCNWDDSNDLFWTSGHSLSYGFAPAPDG